MRRPLTCVLALALWVGAAAACGDDGARAGDATGASTTATTAPTSTAPADPAAAVDEFCTKTEELQALIQGLGEDPSKPPTSEQEARLSALAGETAQMMVTLQMSASTMLPGDAARFQECAAVLGGTGAIPAVP